MKTWIANPATPFLQQVLDSCRDLVFVKNDAFEILYANAAMLKIYPPEQRDTIIGFTTVESFTPQEVELFLAKDREAFEVGFSQAVE